MTDRVTILDPRDTVTVVEDRVTVNTVGVPGPAGPPSLAVGAVAHNGAGNWMVSTGAGWANQSKGWTDVRDHGMAPANTAAANRTALVAALTAATPSAAGYDYATTGGATVYIPPGFYQIDGAVVDVPNHVDVIGAGSALTVLSFTASGSGLRFGDNVTGASGGTDHVRGASGGFVVYGGGIANTPIVWGLGNGQTPYDIKSIGALQDGMVFSSHQNAKGHGLEVHDCGRDGFVFDMGAGGNMLTGAHAGRCGRSWLRFQQSATKPVGGAAYAQPENNTVAMGQLEYAIHTGPTQADAPAQMTGPGIYHGAGRYNRMHAARISAHDATAAFTCVQLIKAGAEESTRFALSGLEVVGVPAYTTALDVQDGTILVIEGLVTLAGHLQGVYAQAAAEIRVAGRLEYVNVSGRFVSNGGTFAEYTVTTWDEDFYHRATNLAAVRNGLYIEGGDWDNEHIQLEAASGDVGHIYYDDTADVMRFSPYGAPGSKAAGIAMGGRSGTATVADGGAITHGLGKSPTFVGLTPRVGDRVAVVAGLTSTTITVDLKVASTGADVAVAEDLMWFVHG